MYAHLGSNSEDTRNDGREQQQQATTTRVSLTMQSEV